MDETIADIVISTSAKNIDITVTTSSTATNACRTCTLVGKITLSNSILAFLNNFVNFPICVTFCCGRPRGTRTPGTWFWRPVLYQLSYWPNFRHKEKSLLELHLFVFSMCSTPLAILLQRKFSSSCFFVLGCVVVSSCALLTAKVNCFSHVISYISRYLQEVPLQSNPAGVIPCDCSSSPSKVYSITLDTTPAPTVLPPSRIANRVPSSSATGAISSTMTLTLSPGITISVPSGSVTEPVTSVVLT